MTSPAAFAPASQDASPPVIWALLHAIVEPHLYEITRRRIGKTMELFIRPIERTE